MIKAFRNRKGFSLAEVLIVVAILCVLFGVTAVETIHNRKKIRQTEYDSKAEILFDAANSRFTELYAANGADIFENFPTGIILSSSTDREELLPDSFASEELTGQNWKIVFNPKNGFVYEAYYSETGKYSGDFNIEDIKIKGSNGLRVNPNVGYYGSNGVGNYNDPMKDCYCRLTMINKDILKAHVEVSQPGATLHFVISGSKSGLEKTKEVFLGSEQSFYDMVFDSAEAGNGFATLWSGFIPGEDITVTVWGSVPGKTVESGPAVTATANSLFSSYNESTKTATVRYGRHLQNLNLSYSGPDAVTVKHVIQDRSIDFTDVGEDMWGRLYGLDDSGTADQWHQYLAFKPIVNGNIETYISTNGSGLGCTITGLVVEETDGNGGLFDTFSGKEITGVNLVGAYVHASDDVGALAGVLSLSDDIEIDNCTSYLMYPDYSGKTAVSTQWIKSTGGNAGGLVGSITGGGPSYGVSFLGCSASSVVYSQATQGSSGGFFGTASTDVSISNSYADCYVFGAKCSGGFGGGMSESVDIEIEDSYTAGFLFAPSEGAKTAHAGGYVPGVLTADNSYSVFDYSRGNADIKDIVAIPTGKSFASPFFSYGEADIAKKRKLTTHYDISGETGTLDYYDYPMLKKTGHTGENPEDLMHHYGDWAGEIGSTVTWDLTDGSSWLETTVYPQTLLPEETVLTCNFSLFSGAWNMFTDDDNNYSYSFVGWKDITEGSSDDKLYLMELDGENAGKLYTMSGEDRVYLPTAGVAGKTYKAVYKKQFTVTFILVDYEKHPIGELAVHTETRIEGDTVSTADIDASKFLFTKDGDWILDGWYNKNNDQKVSGAVSSSCELYAYLKCEVSYYAVKDTVDGLTPIKTETVCYGSSFVPYSEYVDGEGYCFDGIWHTANPFGLNAEVLDSTTLIQGNLNAYTQLKCTLKYTVRYTGGSSESVERIVDYGVYFDSLDHPAEDEFSGLGDKSLGEWKNAADNKSMSGKTITESQQEVYTEPLDYVVVFHINRDSGQIAAENLKQTIIEEPKYKSGKYSVTAPSATDFHNISGENEVFTLSTTWYTDPGCTTSCKLSDLKFGTSKSITLYAKWTGVILHSDAWAGADVYTPTNGVKYKKYAAGTGEGITGYTRPEAPTDPSNKLYPYIGGHIISGWYHYPETGTEIGADILDINGKVIGVADGYTTKELNPDAGDDKDDYIYKLNLTKGILELYGNWKNPGDKYVALTSTSDIQTPDDYLIGVVKDGKVRCIKMDAGSSTVSFEDVTPESDGNISTNTVPVDSGLVWHITGTNGQYKVNNKVTAKNLAVRESVSWFLIFPTVEGYSLITTDSTQTKYTGGLRPEQVDKPLWSTSGNRLYVQFYLGKADLKIDPLGVSTDNVSVKLYRLENYGPSVTEPLKY